MSNIKVGDLVVITHDCCNHKTLGFVGEAIEIDAGFFQCEDCRHEHVGIQARIAGLAKAPDSPRESMGWVPIAWLKRIPPLSELEKNKEELHA